MKVIKDILNEKHFNEVVNKAAIAFAVKAVGAGLSFGFNVLLARLLGAEGAGVYFLAITITTIASVIARIGLDNALLRFTAAGAAENDWVSIMGNYRLGITISSILSIIITAVLFISAPWLAVNLFSKPELIQPLSWMVLAVFPMTLFLLHVELLKGLKHIFESQMIQGMVLPLVNILGLYPLVILWEINGSVFSYIIAVTTSAIISLWLWWRIEEVNRKSSGGSFSYKPLLASCTHLFPADILNRAIIPWLPYMLLGYWVSSDDVGVFGVSIRTAMLISFVLIAVNSILAPKISALYRREAYVELEKLIKQTTLMLIFIGLIFSIVLIAFAENILNLFGDEFTAGTTVLVILVIGQFVNVACGSVGYLLIMSGNEKSYRNCTLVSAMVLVVCGVILIPMEGIVGAAITSSLALVVFNIIATFYVKKHLNIFAFPDFHFGRVQE